MEPDFALRYSIPKLPIMVSFSPKTVSNVARSFWYCWNFKRLSLIDYGTLKIIPASSEVVLRSSVSCVKLTNIFKIKWHEYIIISYIRWRLFEFYFFGRVVGEDCAVVNQIWIIQASIWSGSEYPQILNSIQLEHNSRKKNGVLKTSGIWY